MYILIRKIHLYTALALTLFVLMYALTGFVIYRPSWFPNNRETTTRSAVLDWDRPDFAQEDKAIFDAMVLSSEDFRDAFGISARYEFTRNEQDGGYTLVYRKPGVEERVTAYAARDSLTVMTIRNGGAWTWNRMHQMHLFRGGPLYFVWGVLLDIVSLSVILFAITGVWLWYTLKAKNRRVGWILISASTAYTLGSILYLMA